MFSVKAEMVLFRLCSVEIKVVRQEAVDSWILMTVRRLRGNRNIKVGARRQFVRRITKRTELRAATCAFFPIFCKAHTCGRLIFCCFFIKRLPVDGYFLPFPRQTLNIGDPILPRKGKIQIVTMSLIYDAQAITKASIIKIADQKCPRFFSGGELF